MIHEYLNAKRVKIVKRFLNDIADLDLGAGKIPKARLSLDINSTFKPDIVADVRFLPLKDRSIKSLVCSHVIEHVHDLSNVMNEMKRILEKGGIALFFVPNDGSFLWKVIRPLWSIYYERMVSKADSPRTHVHSFNKSKLYAILSRHFNSVQIIHLNFRMEFSAICTR